jgi:hypothetical protein
MADVFISYATPDREVAARLAAVLEHYGLTVWWDRKIAFGTVFDQVIEKELDRAKAVVTLWSKHSVVSEWVRNEASIAAERSALVPARIDACKLPLEFRRRQTADLCRWIGGGDGQDLKALVTAICDTCEKEPIARTGTPDPELSGPAVSTGSAPDLAPGVTSPRANKSPAPGPFHQVLRLAVILVSSVLAGWAISYILDVGRRALFPSRSEVPQLKPNTISAGGVRGVDWAYERVFIGPGQAKRVLTTTGDKRFKSTGTPSNAIFTIYVDGESKILRMTDPTVIELRVPGVHDVLATCDHRGPATNTCFIEISDAAD